MDFFNNKEHEERYKNLKSKMGFKGDIGEFASFAYLMSSRDINDYIDILLDENGQFKLTEKAEKEIEKNTSNSQNVLIKLAIGLYTGAKCGDVRDIFPSLDNYNFKIAINAIKINRGI